MREPALRARAHDRRWIALRVLCAGSLMIVLDVTIVNVALPAIQDDLGFSHANLAWVVNAYLVAFGGLLLLGGRLGDLIGRRRVFLTGLCVFTLASLLCGLAQSPGMLVGARFLQGAGGALVSSQVLGMIVTMFREPREQAKAIGIWGFVASAGGSLGLVAGGVLTEGISWHWIFFVNVPIGVVAALLALRFVEDFPGVGLAQGADLPGAALLTSGLMLGIYVIVNLERWGSTRALGWGALSVTIVVAFLARQGRVAAPLMPLRLFRVRNMNAANAAMVLAMVGMITVFFLGALSMQHVLGYSPLEVGLAFLPNLIVAAVVSLYVAGPASLRFGTRPVVVVALVVIGVALVLFARIPVDGTLLVDVMPPMVLMGVGDGLVLPVLTRAAMADVPPSVVGLAAGLVRTLQELGAAVGLAAMATLAAERTAALRARGEPLAAALNGGYHLAFLVSAALVVVAIGVVLAVLRPREEQATAESHALEGATRTACAETGG